MRALADENGPPVNDDAPPVDKIGLLTELEGLNKRQAVIIAALKGVDATWFASTPFSCSRM